MSLKLSEAFLAYRVFRFHVQTSWCARHKVDMRVVL